MCCPTPTTCGRSGRLVPAVIQNNIDVGGTGAFQQSTTSVHGSRGGSETNYLIDGMNIGSVSGDGGIQILLRPVHVRAAELPDWRRLRRDLARRLRLQHGDADRHEPAARLVHVQRHRRHRCSSTTSPPSCARSFCSVCRRWHWQANPDLQPGSKVLKMYDLGP